jgi:hypothetical protein
MPIWSKLQTASTPEEVSKVGFSSSMYGREEGRRAKPDLVLARWHLPPTPPAAVLPKPPKSVSAQGSPAAVLHLEGEGGSGRRRTVGGTGVGSASERTDPRLAGSSSPFGREEEGSSGRRRPVGGTGVGSASEGPDLRRSKPKQIKFWVRKDCGRCAMQI